MYKLQQVVFAICSNPANLLAYLAGKCSVTVETEYGDTMVPGSYGALVHHGARAYCELVEGEYPDPETYSPAPGPGLSRTPAPCSWTGASIRRWLGLQINGTEVIGLSHIDLDTLGGILALCDSNAKSKTGGLLDLFWAVAAEVDVRGVHKLQMILDEVVPLPSSANPSELDIAQRRRRQQEVRAFLNAWWAWSEGHRVYAPRDGSVLDVTSVVNAALAFLEALLAPHSEAEIEWQEEALAKGAAFAQQEKELNESSFRHWAGTSSCLVRSAEGFVNHLYTAPNGELGKAVVSLNPKTGAVTVSLADPVPGISCREIVQQLWGPLAGGHDGIAGSPRGEFYGEEQLQAAAEAMASALNRAFPD